LDAIDEIRIRLDKRHWGIGGRKRPPPFGAAPQGGGGGGGQQREGGREGCFLVLCWVDRPPSGGVGLVAHVPQGRRVHRSTVCGVGRGMLPGGTAPRTPACP